MAKRTITMDPECIAQASIDAINRFCREALVKRNYLSADAIDDPAIREEKYRIASEVA